MKVYINEINTEYAGGMAIVAASSIEEAHDLLANHLMSSDCDDKEYYLESDYFYLKENWKLIPDVISKHRYSTIIAENSYEE